LWDLLGLLRNKTAAYSEYPALNGIDLDVRRGEKVAIIGRNGAGKSTLLKIITMVIEPTSGTLNVRGKTQALLQIGTGFHPDFTGRENVIAYLAQVGIRGARMRELTEEIVDFAEIESYIDQPLKTYSTGMAMRLMFAASTVLAPEILVIDEVLSVGDAYFAHKSFERIEQLCAGGNTTLLLVSHDIYNASKLCDRMIWIDRGRILMDDKSPEVMKAYDQFIHTQEEERLRLRALKQPAVGGEDKFPGLKRFVLEMRSPNNLPLENPVYISRVQMFAGAENVAGILEAADPFDDGQNAFLQKEAGAWGEVCEWQERVAWPFLNRGTRFHKASIVFRATDEVVMREDFHLEVDYWAENDCQIDLVLCDQSAERYLGRIGLQSGSWNTVTQKAQTSASGDALRKEPAVLSGSGALWITHTCMRSSSGRETLILQHNEPVHIDVSYRAASTEPMEFEAVLVFHKDGVADVCRMISGPLRTSSRQRIGTVSAYLDRMLLGAGVYTLTVMFVKRGYFAADPKIFYSLNPDVYCVSNRGLEFKVDNGGVFGTGTAVVAECEWSVADMQQVPAESASG
jgi:lipopolysaccharide transport system ATP-binding protein